MSVRVCPYCFPRCDRPPGVLAAPGARELIETAEEPYRARRGGQRLPRWQGAGEGDGSFCRQHGLPADLHPFALFCTLKLFLSVPSPRSVTFFREYVGTLSPSPRSNAGNHFIIFRGTSLFVSLMQRPVLKVQYMTQPLVEDVCVCLLLCMSQDLGFCKTSF